MWFHLAFFRGKADLLAVVASDGNIYFVGDDVGRFLGYRNPYQFAANHAKHNLKDLIPPSIQKFQNFQKKKILCFTVDEMLERMKMCHRRFDQGKEFLKLWNDGYVLNPECVPVVDSKNAKRLFVVNKKSSVCFQDWIRQYVSETLKMFQEFGKYRVTKDTSSYPIENHLETESNTAHLDNALRIEYNFMFLPSAIFLYKDGQVYSYKKVPKI